MRDWIGGKAMLKNPDETLHQGNMDLFGDILVEADWLKVCFQEILLANVGFSSSSPDGIPVHLFPLLS